MPPAMPTDWKSEPLPNERSKVPLDRRFSSSELLQMQAGLVPEAMEDKWFIYWDNDALYFHRSWTGFCIYVVHFAAEQDSCRMVEVDVNCNEDQYKSASDEFHAKMITYLIDLLLLRRDADFPSDDPNPDTQALMNWSHVGRAMFGEHPTRE